MKGMPVLLIGWVGGMKIQGEKPFLACQWVAHNNTSQMDIRYEWISDR